MSRIAPRLFARLRRHRGVWALALAVLLFKFAMATFCLLDGPRVVAVPGEAPALVALDTGDTDDDACVLDGGSACHCSCAHSVAMPMSMPVMITAVPREDLVASPPAGLQPGFEPSPLRPPIA
ncbi:MAG: hypothetical protein ABWZ85_12450 [Luteibacter sp.]